MNDYLAARLRAARKNAGMTQRALAAETGLSQPFVAQIEQGDKMASIETLTTVAKTLGVTIPWLLGQGIGDGTRGYKPDVTDGRIRDLLDNPNTPPGLRDLATDSGLIANLGVTEAEWRALTSIELPGEVSKDGYVNLLFTVRSITRR